MATYGRTETVTGATVFKTHRMLVGEGSDIGEILSRERLQCGVRLICFHCLLFLFSVL